MVWLRPRASSRAELVKNLIREGIIKTSRVERAMLSIPRELFVWEGLEDRAYDDTPLPLGSTGQTISAPHMVAMMLEELDLRLGLRVLEVGAGSGYNAACMASMIGPSGRVVSVEIREDLVDRARAKLRAAGVGEMVDVVRGDGSRGWPPYSKEETYDRVVVTAGTPSVPQPLLDQLKKGGILLAPLGSEYILELTRFEKSAEGRLSRHFVCDCVFVPLVHE